MSKYSKYIIAVLLAVVVVIIAWQLVFSRGDRQETKINYPDMEIKKVTIAPTLDKSEYQSNEQVNLKIEINSNVQLNNLLVKVEGMKDRYGENYFQEKKVIDVSPNQPTSITIEKELPICSKCSGYIEGEYDLDVDVMNNAYVLAKEKVTFELKP